MNKYSRFLFFGVLLVLGLSLISWADAKTASNPVPVSTIKVTVSTRYEPKSIEVRKGQAVKLAFYRADDKNCGGEVVFPKLNIRKELPVGKTVLVEFTPRESGEIAFTCGMNMMRGKIVVTD